MTAFLWIAGIWGFAIAAFVGAWWAWTAHIKRIGAWDDDPDLDGLS